MNDIKEIFRLKFELKQSNRTIAESLEIGRTTVPSLARHDGGRWHGHFYL